MRNISGWNIKNYLGILEQVQTAYCPSSAKSTDPVCFLVKYSLSDYEYEKQNLHLGDKLFGNFGDAMR